MYKFTSNLDKKEYDNFICNYSMSSFMQEYNWSNIKDNWSHFHCGLYKDEKLVGVCLILVKKIIKNINMFYIPRGYLIDFTNFEDLNEMTNSIKKLAKENKAYMVKIDPNFCISDESFKDEDVEHNYSKDYELKIISNEFVLNYDDNGGSGCSSVLKNVYYNKAYGDLCVPRKEGYEFIGWYEKKDDRSNEVNLETVLDKANDVTIYAHYRRPIVVTLIQYEGTHIKNVELLSYVYNDDNGANIMLPRALEYADDRCDGWTSLGWSTRDDASDGNVEYKGNKEYLFSKDLVLYAKYEKKVVFKYRDNKYF